jgi:ribosomal protein S18 acetylase RimI-like enzyme
MRFQRYDDAPDFVLEAIDGGLEEYNLSVAPLAGVKALTVALFDDDRVVGGAVGRTWGKCCELLQLWVATGHRNAGHGSALLQEFERRGAERGCNVFYLTTLSYQAPGFYAKHGYCVLAKIDGYPDGIAKYLMQRREG